MSKTSHKKKKPTLQAKLHEVIFEADTPMGKVFDISLLVLIVLSIIMVMLESIDSIKTEYTQLFNIVEWTLTILFSIEYVLRLYVVFRPLKYATSFFGIIDLLAILPSYLALFLGSSQAFLIIRALRLMRIFRILKLGHFLSEGQELAAALRASFNKITVFLFFVLILVTILGALMYLIEGGSNQDFDNIPLSIYWAVVTLTTVGYGDITPSSPFGQFIAAIIMIMGYAILAVPTGIVTGELIKGKRAYNTQACRFCGAEGHDDDAVHCKYCGELMNE